MSTPENSDQRPSTDQQGDDASSQDYETVLKQVTERVWELWQQDVRRNQERKQKKIRR